MYIHAHTHTHPGGVQVLVDAGSSRRSSVSEIASSPLAGGPKDKAEGEILRKQAKTSTSKSD